MGTIYRAAPLSEKKPLLRHIASDFVLDGHKIYPKYREPFNIFAQGNKKCLEIKGKYPKSSKHLIWGQTDSALLTYVIEQEELLTVYLDDLDHDYDVAPSTLGLDYHLICNQWFGQPVNCR